MNEEEMFFGFLKQYIDEGNVPDYNGEYPQPYELTIEDAELILNVIKKKDLEIERLNKRILTLEETLRKANNNVLKDVAMIKTHEMVKQEIVQRLIETSRILESGSDKE